MIEAIRTERRFGVTSSLTDKQRANLFSLRREDAYQDLLDVMEMCCIEIEGVLLNTSSDKEAEVLANHKMAKAAWLIFTHLQEKVDAEIALYLSSVATQPLVPEPTAAEMEIENILNPTRGFTAGTDHYEN